MTQPVATEPLRIAVLLCVCEGEQSIAEGAVRSLRDCMSPHVLTVFIVDDGSPSQVGQRIAAYCESCGFRAHVTRLNRSLGFRGCAQRTFTGLRAIAEADADAARGEPFDLVLKLDPDTLLIRREVGDVLATHCRAADGIWSPTFRMRHRDRLLLLLDLLPIGFRRVTKDGVIQRERELKRWRPVWWFRFGWRALLRRGGFRFRSAGGAFYLIAMPVVRKQHRRGFLSNQFQDRHGFVSSEEDVVATMFALAGGAKLIDLGEFVPQFGNLGLGPTPDVAVIREQAYYVVHPLKDTPPGRQAREVLALSR